MKPATKRFNVLNHYRKFSSHGNGIILIGRVRSGKTTLVSIIVKQLLENGFAVISNVRFAESVFEKYPYLRYITSDLDYFREYITLPDGMPSLLVWDDAQAGDGMKSTQTVSKSGDKLQKFLIFIGKFETNYLYIAHQKYIPDVLTRGFEPIILYKLQRNSFYVGDSELCMTDNEIRQRCYFVPLPKLTESMYLPILSRAPATFEFVIDLKALYKYLSDFSVGENLKSATREFLEINQSDNDGKRDLKKMTYEDIVTALYLKSDGKLTGKEKLYQVINSRILYSTLDKLKRGI